jgi:hypothetical protein
VNVGFSTEEEVRELLIRVLTKKENYLGYFKKGTSFVQVYKDAQTG